METTRHSMEESQYRFLLASYETKIPYFFGYKTVFFLPKQSQKSRSILSDGSRSLGLFRKGKTRFTAKSHRTDLIIYTHYGEGKPRLIAE